MTKAIAGEHFHRGAVTIEPEVVSQVSAAKVILFKVGRQLVRVKTRIEPESLRDDALKFLDLGLCSVHRLFYFFPNAENFTFLPINSLILSLEKNICLKIYFLIFYDLRDIEMIDQCFINHGIRLRNFRY